MPGHHLGTTDTTDTYHHTPFWHGRTEGCTGFVRESILTDRSSRSIFGDFLFYHTPFVRESCTVLTTLLSNRCFLANICSMLFFSESLNDVLFNVIDRCIQPKYA